MNWKRKEKSIQTARRSGICCILLFWCKKKERTWSHL